MKVFILTLLVLNSLCFALGGEEEKADFVDLDADEGEVLPEVDDYVEEDEEQDYMDDSVEDEEDSQEEEGYDEPKDPDGFKDDAFDSLEDPNKVKGTDNSTGKRPTTRPPPKVVLPIVEKNPKPPKPSEEPGSGLEPEADADLKDKLGLN